MMDEYERFKLQWMLDHGYSLSDLMRELQALQHDDPEDSDRISIPVTELFKEWESDSGFGSEIWPCKAEWAGCEGNEDNFGAEPYISDRQYGAIRCDNCNHPLDDEPEFCPQCGARVDYRNLRTIERDLDELYGLVQRERNGERLTPEEFDRYVALYEEIHKLGGEIPFGVEI